MTRPRPLSLFKFAGAASLIAMSAACASKDDRYYSTYQSGYSGYADATYNDRYDGRRDGYVNADYRGGIDEAREAHRRYREYEAERRDGDCERTVRIRRGETLSDIAEYCDVPVAALISANPNIRNPRAVAAGETLRVPAVRGEVYEGSYRYAYRDALYRDASYREDYAAAKWIHDHEGRDAYTIRRGDTLADIAWRFDVPLRTLYRMNPGVEPRRLDVGQRIYLPDYAETSPRDRDRRDYVYYEDEPPLISITPARGPRDGKIRVIGDNFRQGEKVTVYFGDSQDSLSELKIVETDGDGRINELVTLPDTYGHDEAYFAFRPSNKDSYILSEAYAVERAQAQAQARAAAQARLSNSASGRAEQVSERYNGAEMRAMQDSVYWGDKITLRAEGFPPDTPVAIYGGPNRNELVKLSEIRSGPRGRFSADVGAPENGRGGEVLFVAAIEDGPRTIFSERVRVLDRNGGYSDSGYIREGRQSSGYSDGYLGANYADPAAQSPRRLERGVENDRGWFSRFRRDRNDDYVGSKVSNAVGGVDAAGSAAIVGILTDEGQQCPALRDDAGNLYTLLGDLEGFDDGDRVLIRGSVQADDRICGQAETVQLYEIEEAPW